MKVQMNWSFVVLVKLDHVRQCEENRVIVQNQQLFVYLMLLPLAPVATAIAPVVPALIVALLVAARRRSATAQVLLVRRRLSLEGPVPAVAPGVAPASVLLLPGDTEV